MSLHVERFAFDRIFTSAAPDDLGRNPSADLSLEIAALRAELALRTAELESCEARARAEGFEAGLAQARGERDVALLSAVDALQAGIEALDSRYDETEKRVAGDAAEVALAAADLLAARALEHAPGAAIDEAIGRTLRQVARGTDIAIRVHPDLAADIEARIEARQAQDRRRLRLTVIPDDMVAMGDAELLWDQGGMTLDAQSRRDTIRSELETLLAG